MLKDLFGGRTAFIKYALLFDDGMLRKADFEQGQDNKKIYIAEKCRYIDLVIPALMLTDYDEEEDCYRTYKKAKDTYRIIVTKETEDMIIKKLEDIGLIEVPKGAEDPEDLKRVWVR